MKKEFKFKVVMLGDFAVGKTSLVRRFVYDVFSDNYLTTIGVKVTKKEVELDFKGESYKVVLLIWDIAGRDGVNDINEAYLRGAKGAIIVGDITRYETLKSLPEYVDMIGDSYVLGINKIDLVDINKVKENVEKELRKDLDFKEDSLFFTSAKDGTNVNGLFNRLSELIIWRNLLES